MKPRIALRRAALGALGALALLLAAFVLGVVWPTPQLKVPAVSGPVALVGVTVVDLRAGVLHEGQTVVIDGGTIVASGDDASSELPVGTRVVDGRGRYVMPALWDMHAHVFAISPLFDLPLHIAYGVTNVRDLQGCPKVGDPFIACAEDKRRWTAEALAGERVGPRIVASSSFMANGPSMLERIPDAPSYFGTADADDARAFVRHFADDVEMIKVYDRIPRDAYFALVDEARRLGLDVVGHRPHAVSAVEAAAHQRSLEHARFLLHESFDGSEALRGTAGTPAWHEDRRAMVDRHDPARAEAIFEAMVEHDTWYVPTHLTRWVDAYADDPAVREDPALRYLHPLLEWQWREDVDATIARDPSPEAREAYLAFYQKGLELTGAAHRAGVPILVGTDYAVAGLYVHRELEQLVLAGLSPLDALRAATVNPARYFRLEDQYGAVAPGYVADLVVLTADPLADIKNSQAIDAVVFNGRWYDRSALDRIERHVENQARSWSVACMVLWRFIRNPVSY